MRGSWRRANMTPQIPLLEHPYEVPSAFRPGDLIEAVRLERGLDTVQVPEICVLDFDGDLFDGLLREKAGSISRSWACFHTQMIVGRFDGVECGVIPRTIGGPYAVLIAEQLHAAGVRLTVGLTSAGRVATALPLPSIVLADEAVRDEGTSLHYLPPARTIATPTPTLVDHLARSLTGLSELRRGLVWSTDAPYRETRPQLSAWADAGVLGVEMQAASLFAFGQAKGAHVGVVALVSNSIDRRKEGFDTGGQGYRVAVLSALAKAGQAFLGSSAT